MTTLNVTDRDGVEHRVTAAPGSTLMEVLRDQELGVMALCGGMCSCATCHVYIDESWFDKLPAPQSDETELLGDLPDHKPNSRLSCQIKLMPAYDGLKVTVAPEE
ncbi:MAG: 2Fe-2S iron-sulfur cluster-binding protein [Steroidobacteraceae bacterium]